MTVAQHAKRGTWLYLTSTAHPPYSTADLHQQHCTDLMALKRYMQADQHAAFTGAKWA